VQIRPATVRDAPAVAAIAEDAEPVERLPGEAAR
jgi:hypothetical protein